MGRSVAITINNVFLISESMIEDMNRPEFKDYIGNLSSNKYGVDRDKIPTTVHTMASFRKLSLD